MKMCISIVRTYTKNENITSMQGTGYFLKIAKINSQQAKFDQSVLIEKKKKYIPENTKNGLSAKINFRVLPHGIYGVRSVSYQTELTPSNAHCPVHS